MRRPLEPLSLVLLAVGTVAGCKHEQPPDAYGNIEATSVVVSAQTAGQLLWFKPAEGARLSSGVPVATVDTTQLVLQLRQVAAQRSGAVSRGHEVARQLDVLEVQRGIAQRTYERTRRLFEQQAATAQQLDQAERDYRTLSEQIQAVTAQRRTVDDDVAAAAAHAAQIEDQIRKSHVDNPVAGTVLATYVKAGEVVQPGQALYKIANLDTVDLRAYVTGSQLAAVRLGQEAHVSIDVGEGTRRVVTGRVTWISSEAEFTPTPIQTRDERANLVYAIKVRIANSAGLLKIGMPADVQFALAGPGQ